MNDFLNTYELRPEILVSDSSLFRKFVYTPLEDAIEEIKNRRKDPQLTKEMTMHLGELPDQFQGPFKAVLFRQLCTPNFEFRLFEKTAKKHGMEMLIIEYLRDKFTSINPIKRSLGKIKFFQRVGKKKGIRIEIRNIIDFNSSNGKKIKDVNTIWGQSLVDFHHQVLARFYPESIQDLFDASDWFTRAGHSATEYYFKYLLLFIKNSILFENFILKDRELDFVKNVFLPSFISVWKKTGLKPLIVPLLPFESEADDFWIFHPSECLICVDERKRL